MENLFIKIFWKTLFLIKTVCAYGNSLLTGASVLSRTIFLTGASCLFCCLVVL